jgi:probable HAF family extracellular repeat protein
MRAKPAVRDQGVGFAVKTKTLGVVALCLLCVGIASAANAITYTLTELNPLPGDNSSNAYGINNAGQVVGQSYPTVGSKAVIWNGGTPTALSPLPSGTTSVGLGINDAAQVVGYSDTTGGVTHAAIWNGTTPTDLGAVSASGINNVGQVVGTSAANHATVWNGTTPTDLGTLGGTVSSATGINNRGQVVGSSGTTGDAAARAVVWNGTTPTALAPLAGDANSYANGINNRGQVVGYDVHIAGISGSQAVIWNGTTPTGLGTLGGLSSVANGINSRGQLVGWSDAVGGPGSYITESHATLWESNGIIIDLNDVLNSTGTGWLLIDALAINDRGQIVGYGAELNDPQNSLAFLLTPDPPLAETPLPAALPLFATGLGALGLLGWRRKRKHAALAA